MSGRIKSVSCGLLCFLAGALLVLLAGAAGTQETSPGRYQIAATNAGGLVLDTQTGQLWARLDVSAVCYDLGTPEHPKCQMIKP